MIWGPILAWYLFLAGLGAGAYATVALANIMKPDESGRFQFGGRLLAPIIVIIGLLLLIIDAEAGFHNPLRFFYLLSNWGSVMTWGTAILALFTLVACLSALLTIVKRPIPKALDYAGLFLALSTAGYTGVLIGVVTSYPLWNSALLPVLFTVSAFSTGISATFLIAVFIAHREGEQLGSLKKLHFALPIIEILLIASLLFVAANGNPAGASSVASLVSGEFALLFWVGLIIIGLMLPIGLQLSESFLPARARKAQQEEPDEEPEEKAGKEKAGRGAALEVISGTGALIGGFLLRYLVLMAAVPLMFL